jgi:hypothetical protein
MSRGAPKRTLPQLAERRDSLGRSTIMARALAARHGVPYVHAAVFAIDVDRIRDALDGPDDTLPFGWEVFLTARYLAWRCDPEDDATRTMLEDAVQSVLELPPSDEGVLGSQLPFAVWVLVARGDWPASVEAWLEAWKKKPKELAKELAPLFADAESNERTLARAALAVALDPPIAPPTREALESLASEDAERGAR